MTGLLAMIANATREAARAHDYPCERNGRKTAVRNRLIRNLNLIRLPFTCITQQISPSQQNHIHNINNAQKHRGYRSVPPTGNLITNSN